MRLVRMLGPAALVLVPLVVGCELVLEVLAILMGGVESLSLQRGGSAVVPFEVSVQVDRFVPDEVDYECSSSVELDLRGARTGATYAALPAGLSYSFNPNPLPFTAAGSVSAELTVTTATTTPAGTYLLTIVAQLADGRMAEASLPLTVEGDDPGETPFNLIVDPTRLVLTAAGENYYTTAYVDIVRDVGFDAFIDLVLEGPGETLANLDYSFAMRNVEPDEQILVIQNVTLPTGDYPLEVVAISDTLSTAVPIVLEVPLMPPAP